MYRSEQIKQCYSNIFMYTTYSPHYSSSRFNNNWMFRDPSMNHKGLAAATRRCHPYMLSSLGVAAADSIELSSFLETGEFLSAFILRQPQCFSVVPHTYLQVRSPFPRRLWEVWWGHSGFGGLPGTTGIKTGLHHVTRSCDSHGTGIPLRGEAKGE